VPALLSACCFVGLPFGLLYDYEHIGKTDFHKADWLSVNYAALWLR
jgi:hypothetical protein